MRSSADKYSQNTIKWKQEAGFGKKLASCVSSLNASSKLFGLKASLKIEMIHSDESW
jgi:hypothetical protein